MSTPQVLLLVLSCRAHRDTRQRAVRETWFAAVPAHWRMLFVEGGADREARIQDDRLLLGVPDDYNHLAEKTFRAVETLLPRIPFAGILKCDDDTYLHPCRFEKAFDKEIPYAGNTRDTLPGKVPYAQGGAYWLNRQACTSLVAQPFASHREADWFLGRTPMRKRGERRKRPVTSIEDFMVGDILLRQGIGVRHDPRFSPDPFPSVFEDLSLFSCHHVNPTTMRRIHLQRLWRMHPIKRLLLPFFRYLPASRKPG
ncbi:MAG: hypothetical protein ACP5I4_12945 [Oceanipulchritudo sp.]